MPSVSRIQVQSDLCTRGGDPESWASSQSSPYWPWHLTRGLLTLGYRNSQPTREESEARSPSLLPGMFQLVLGEAWGVRKPPSHS